MQKKKKSEKKRTRKTDDLPVYCVCRSTDGERFMIACDRCEEWYHGDCISVTPKQAEQIKTFYCHQCRRKEPSLEIVYNSARTPKLRASQLANSSSAGRPERKQSTKGKDQATPVSKSDKPKSESSLGSQLPPDTKTQRHDSKLPPTCTVDTIVSNIDPHPSSSSPMDTRLRDADQNSSVTVPRPSAKLKAASPRTRLCGTCSGCTRLDDCGKCDYCRDRRKFGGPNRIRQKCRLRQCVGSSQHPYAASSRRRKQPSLQSVLMETPPHLSRYPEDDLFDVSSDLSPHLYGHQNSTPYRHYPITPHITMGSKMRRGDMRPASFSHDLDALTSRCYQRLSVDITGDPVDYLDEDSDDDLVLSGLPHCAGPACMSAPIAGGRYCSESCRVKHLKSRTGLRGTGLPRSGPPPGEILYPYNLPYPDHMYCRHHRVYNWHSNTPPPPAAAAASSVAYHTVMQPFDHFGMDDSAVCDALCEPRGRSTIPPYDTLPAHPLSQRMNLPRLMNSNGRSSDVDNGADHSVLCDSGDAVAFIDSMESAMMRGVVSLDMDLNTHPGNSVSAPGNNFYSKLHARPTLDLRHIEDIEGNLLSELDPDAIERDSSVSQGNSHCYYYYMLPYNDLGRRGTGTCYMTSSNPSEKRIGQNLSNSQTLGANHRLVLPNDTSDTLNGVESSYPTNRSFSCYGPSNAQKGSGLSTSGAIATTDKRLVPSMSDPPTSSPPPPSYIPGPDEFYTINDSDDIEINWPQESVSGVSS